MADLKFVGVNFPGVPQYRQADPSADRLLVNTIGPSGASGGPLVVAPISPVTGTDLVLDIRNGSGTVLTLKGSGTLSVFSGASNPEAALVLDRDSGSQLLHFFADTGDTYMRVTEGGTARFAISKSGGTTTPLMRVTPVANGSHPNQWAALLSYGESAASLQPASVYLSETSPEGVISAPPGSTCHVRYPSADVNDGLWIKKIGVGNTGWFPSTISDPFGSGIDGFDDFTSHPNTAWTFTPSNSGDVSWGSNAAAYGFPGAGALALNVSSTAGSKIKAFRFGSGLVLDSVTPVVVTYRLWPAGSGVYADNEFQWLVGVSSDSNITNGVVLFAQWNDGASTRSYVLGHSIAGVLTTTPVILPPLGVGESGYRIRFTLTPSGYSAHYAIDEGAFALLASVAVVLPQSSFSPIMQAEKDTGGGNRTLVCDWMSWSAARYADTIGAPTGSEFGGFKPWVSGDLGAVDNRITRTLGTGGRDIESSAASIDDSGNITGVVGLTATGTVQGATVTATGTVQGATVTATGTVQGATVTSTGVVNGNSANITNNVTVGGTVDGRDVSVDGAKLDNIEPFADVTDTSNVAAAGAVMMSEFNVGYTGPLYGTDGLGARAVLRYNVAASAPTPSDDGGAGYRKGSIWVNTLTGVPYICVSETAATAVWVPIPTAVTSSALYTPSFSPSDGAITITHVDSFRYLRIGSIIHVAGLAELETNGASGPDEITISLPISCPSSTIGFLSGSYTCQQDQNLRGPIYGNVDGVSASAIMRNVATVAGGPFFVTVEFSYRTTS